MKQFAVLKMNQVMLDFRESSESLTMLQASETFLNEVLNVGRDPGGPRQTDLLT